MEGYDYILISLLGIAFYWDVRLKRIPNWLTVGGAVTGVFYHFIGGGLEGLQQSFVGMLVAGGIFLVLYLFRALGAGDVKLFAAIGAITGTQFALFVMMYSIVYAGVIGVLILLCTRTFIRKMFYTVYQLFRIWFLRDLKGLDDFQKQHGTRFAFMYAVCPGVITTYYYLTF